MTWAQAYEKACWLAAVHGCRYRVKKIGNRWLALPGSDHLY